MNPVLILVCQPGMDLPALLQAIEIAAHQQGHVLQALPPMAGADATHSFALMPDDRGVLLKTLHPNVTPIRRPS